MPKRTERKDNKGRVLRKGEGQRTEDLLYFILIRIRLAEEKEYMRLH